MYAAYESLSDRMKTYLDGLTALHDGEQVYRGLYKNCRRRRQAGLSARRASGGAHPSGDRQEGALRQPRLHPPHHRRAARRERRILRYLYQHMENPLFQCRFRWSENAIAFWDNRCVQHRAMWDYWPHTRSGTA
jgi:taurine dioxygenase